MVFATILRSASGLGLLRLARSMASSTSRPVTFGGIGALLTVEDILSVATGASVELDPSGLDRLKKCAKKNLTQSPGADPSPACTKDFTNREILPAHHVRAVQAVRIMTLMKGGQCPSAVEGLAAWMNSGCVPRVFSAGSDSSVLSQLAESLTGTCDTLVCGSPPSNKPGSVEMSQVDLQIFQTGSSASTGIAAVVAQGAKMLLEAAIGVAGLSCEALRADVRGFEVEVVEASPYKSSLDAADDVRCLLEGSSVVNPRKGGAGIRKEVQSIPMLHGACRDALSALSSSLRNELSGTALHPSASKGMTNFGISPTLASTLISLSQSLLRLGSGGLGRIALELDELPHLRPTAGTPGPGSEGTEGDTLHARMLGLVKVLRPLLEEREAKLSCCKARVGAIAQGLAVNEMVDGVDIALAAGECLVAVEDIVALESIVSVLCLRALEGSAAVNLEVDHPAPDTKSKKGKKKARGLVVGKGTGILRSGIESRLMGSSANSNGRDIITIGWPFPEEVMDGTTLIPFIRTSSAFSHLSQDLPGIASLVRSLVEANQIQRKPKIAKGTRDFLPEQMQIRERAFDKITSVFKRHGAVSIDTPVFELRETLMGKYGEDSKLIYDLADQGGEILSLRYDLTVPFARFVALQGVGNIKRYHIGKVYRRDQPQMTRGRFREFFQCDFDIAGTYATMVPDAEVLKVLVEILQSLELGDFEIKLNHRKLLDATMAIAGVPTSKFRTICSAIDKLDKEPWETVRLEMVEDKGLPGYVADKVGDFVKLKGEPHQLLEKLLDPSHDLSQNADSKSALEELKVLFGYLESMDALNAITFDLSLARGLDYYSGLIYEAVLVGGTVGSIAAGGRYDKLVGMFSGKDVPAVGVSIGIERVFSIMEGLLRAKAETTGVPIRAAETQVLVASIGSGMQQKRMEICNELWGAGIKAEFGFKPNPKMGDQLNHVLENGIPFMVLFGGDELEKGIVKIKDIKSRTEVEIQKEQLVEELISRLASTDAV